MICDEATFDEYFKARHLIVIRHKAEYQIKLIKTTVCPDLCDVSAICRSYCIRQVKSEADYIPPRNGPLSPTLCKVILGKILTSVET